MKISALLAVIAACLAAAQAQKVEKESPNQKDSPTPAPTTSEEQLQTTIQFQELAPEPVTATEKAGVKFKPQLHITNGCHSYAAVNEAGQIGTWLKKADAKSTKCKGSKAGSQVYGRSAWYGRVWGIMYALYFPEVTPEWEHVIVWTNNPNVTKQTILAVSTSTNASSGYAVQTPPGADKMDGTSVKVTLDTNTLVLTTEDGESQDVIMWHQMSNAAREALNNDQSFGGVKVPVNDDYFLLQLGKAWPFKD
ncbi:unnamed protein product [Phytophthora lilii]|uniref:Unnamed protein product n=1 Tax=Phytophthora lilii TaxID=2077276 RepID=A0A9W6WN45_9STRA|nr:unnamed protein product [Phytophthora lilii]